MPAKAAPALLRPLRTFTSSSLLAATTRTANPFCHPPQHSSSPSFCPPLRQIARTYIISTSPSPSASSSFTPSSSSSSTLRTRRPLARRPMSFFSRIFPSFFSSSSSSTDKMAAAAKAQKLIDENPAVVFSKSYCPYCRATKRTLDGLGAKYALVELDQEEDGSDIQEALQKISGQRTVPNIFIGKQHIGGNSDLEEHLHKDLKNLLKASGSLA